MIKISKGRIYIKNPSQAPQGVKVEHGKRGGIYYESSAKTNTQTEEESGQTHRQDIDFIEIEEDELGIKFGGEFAGSITFLPVIDGVGKIKNINIKPEMRGKGLGEKLVRQLEEKFKKDDAKRIETSLVASNAKGFWNKLGYKPCEEGYESWNWCKNLYDNNIQVADTPKEISDKYVNEAQKLNRPIPPITFKDLISKAVNSEQIQKELKGSKIFLLPYSMDCWGFVDPDFDNDIFIPQYDIGFTRKSIYEIYGFKDLEDELKDVLLRDEKKVFDEWKTLTRDDAIQKTLLHEKGHIEIYRLLEQKSGKKEYRKYWIPITVYTEGGKYIQDYDYSNIQFFFDLLKDYMDIPEVWDNLVKYDDARVRAYQLGELIAEDYRLMKGGRQSLFPHKTFYYQDYTMPFIRDSRHKVLKKVFGW